MKYARYLLGVFSLLLAQGASAVVALSPQIHQSANEIQVTLNFPDAQFLRNGGSVGVEVGNLPLTIDAGMPKLPVANVLVALPAGSQFTGYRIEKEGARKMRGTPALSQGMAPLSWLKDPPKNLIPSAAPTIPARFPATDAVVALQKKHGVTIASLNLFPVSYDSHLRELNASKKIVVHVDYAPKQAQDSALTKEQAQSVQALIQNPEVIDSWYASNNRRAGYEYLIIATNNVIAYAGENSVKDLQESLAKRKLNSKVVPLAEVLSTQGKDDPDKVRNFIRKEYQESAIQFVLLMGKSKTSGGGEVIPNRRLWSKISAYLNGGWTDVEEKIAGDIYYSNLDGSFDGNGNGIYAEPNDGEDGGDVDFLSEVTVGRAAMETDAELANFVRKSKWAAENPLSKKSLSLGEDLFPEKDLSGMDYLVQLVGTSSDHGFTTQGFGTDWSVENLDDRKAKWSGSKALKMVNEENFSLVNHLGHSNTSYNMKLSSMFGFPSFTNQNPIFYYTQGCLAGRFYDGSFVDKMVRHQASAFAAMGNSTYGLAPEDPDPKSTKTPGTSHMVHRQFIHALASGKAKSFGAAHQTSKESLLSYKSAQEMRWVNWAANYLGEPSIPSPF